MDLPSLYSIILMGVVAMTPSAAPLTQRIHECREIHDHGIITSEGANAHLAQYNITGCIAYVDNGTYRCVSNGGFLYLQNGRSVPIAWGSRVTYLSHGVLPPNDDTVQYIPSADADKDTPPVEVEVAFCE